MPKGCMTGMAIATGYINVALAFWQGSRFLVDGNTSFTDVVTITIATKTAAFAVLGTGAHIGPFTSAVASAARIFSMIERVSPIDPSSEDGNRIESLKGTIEFRNIRHIYPTRPRVTVASNLTLTFPSGKTTAVVGASGSGKSTIVHLIERFYDPIDGQIVLDGHDLRSLNLRWLRNQIRVVSQEPLLFDTTISENIEQGLVGTEHEDSSAEKKQCIIEDAAKLASAHDFVQHLPLGYNTHVGARGSKLSGGQKQRIAIARAIVANPRVLILDEATSALDGETETKLQNALNDTAAKRTTIVIAHRLSTVRDADNIIVLDQGRVTEQGTHLALMDLNGAYRRLVEAQANAPGSEGENDIDNESIDQFDGRSHMHVDEKADAKFSTVHDVDESLPLKDSQKNATSAYSFRSTVLFVASMNRKEYHIIAIGLICAIITGCEEPIYAILFGKSIVAISLPSDEGSKIRSQAGFWALMLFVLAVVEGIVFCVQGVAFAFCSERLIHTARSSALESLLHQDVAFFDKYVSTTFPLHARVIKAHHKC